MRILITSGGTKVRIDKVRDITNMSNGTFGSRIAHVALEMGHEVRFFCAERSCTPFTLNIDLFKDSGWHNTWWLEELFGFHKQYSQQYSQISFRNFEDYQIGLKHQLITHKPDVVILAAAVSDYGVANFVDGKIRTQDNLQINLEPLPKVITAVKEYLPTCKLVGFKLLIDAPETELIEEAHKSIRLNFCDLVVANNLASLQANNHQLFLVRPDQVPVRFCKNDSPDDVYYLARKVVEAATEGVR